MSNRQRQSEEKMNGKGAGGGERFVYQDDEMLEKSFDWGQFKRLAVYMKPYSKQIIPIVIVMMIVGAITKLSIPLIISTTIDSSLYVGGDAKFLFGMVALMLGV